MSSSGSRRRTGVRRRDTDVVVVLVRDDIELACWRLVGSARPDLATVDELARLQLAARRLGCEIRLRRACAELWGLLDLAGLTDVVAGGDDRRLEPGGQPEEGEQVGVEKVVMPDDPVA